MRMRRAPGWCAVGALLLLALVLTAANLRPSRRAKEFALAAPEAAYLQWAGPARPCLTGPVNINAAGVDELDTLPGVGPAIARRIVEERGQNGPFFYPEDLMNVRGIGEKTLKKLLSHIRLQ